MKILDIKDSLQRISYFADFRSRNRRKRLKNKLFTIISNDCWGAEVYKDFQLPFNTPFIGTFVAGPCFMQIATDFRRLITLPITFRDESKYDYVNELRKKAYFPTGVLDDNVEIHFLHYGSVEEARAKWERRVARINFDQTFFKLSADKDLFTEEHLRMFDALPTPKKIAFSRMPHPSLSSVVTIPDYIIDGKSMYAISLRYFDIVAWLNQSGRGGRVLTYRYEAS